MSDDVTDLDEIETPPEEMGDEELLEVLGNLRLEHRRVDIEIKALLENGVADALKIQRMKKIKLSIKDQIVFIENKLTPDIIA